jgi:hypothetical protein
MRWLWILPIVLATTLSVSAEDWTTADGKTYHNVVVIAQDPDGVRVKYTGGAGILPYYELPLEIQKRFGQDIDSLEAKRKAAEKALADAVRNAAEQKKLQAAAALQKKGQPANGNEPKPGTVTPSVAPTPTPAQQPEPSQPAQPTIVREDPYPGAKYTYIESEDICYLDSYSADALLLAPDGSIIANPPGQNPSISLRITTEGRKPETPVQIEAAFTSAGTLKGLGADPKIKFLVDGNYINVTPSPETAAAAAAGQDTGNVSFFLMPDQARSILKGKNVNFTIAGNSYRIDETGIAAFQKYFDVVDHLPPASTSFVRSYHKFIAKLPSLITLISTVCEYIILGGFGILVATGVAAFAIGITRFIKM